MQRNCAVCETPFEAQRPQAKYCSGTCRTRASRAGGVDAIQATPLPVSRTVSGLVDAVQAELEAADRVNTVAGQHALELASRIVSAPGMNAGVAGLSKQLQAVIAEAVRGAEQLSDPVDELRARRDFKRKGA